jgi:glycosyltransferase involved in cell wall biosynthesis
MKTTKNILITTQIIDKNSKVFGFMLRWVEEFAKRYDKVTLFCLYEGENDLEKRFPNVKLYTLGKSSRPSKWRYILKFLKYTWQFRNEYDTVFVHQNKEYVLLSGLIWKLLGKKVYLWSNHYMGNILTDVAGMFCNKVFYTSKFSYTAKFKNGVQMPVGVDVKNFLESNYFNGYKKSELVKKDNSVLFLARLSPSKYPDILLNALKAVESSGKTFSAEFVGAPDNDKFPNYEGEILNLKNNLNFKNEINFVGGVPATETAKYYLQNQIYVNIAKSGMLDKTIFEAVLCDCLPLTTSVDFNEMIDGIVGDRLKVEQNSELSLQERIQWAMSLSNQDRMEMVKKIKDFILQNHTLEILANRLKLEL